MLLVALLCGCGSHTDGESIRAHFEALEGFEAQIEITADLGESVLDFSIQYDYNKEDNDRFTITAPESLAGISGTIAGTDNAVFSLQYDGLALDDAMPQRTGLTPADALFCLMNDLRTAVDHLELLVDKDMWPVPTYGDLMFEV